MSEADLQQQINELKHRLNLVENGNLARVTWTDWTPTISGSASMTVSNVVINRARYLLLARTLFYNLTATFTVGGTVNGTILATLPVDVAIYHTSFGYAFTGGAAVWGAYTIKNAAMQLGVRAFDQSNWVLGDSRYFTIRGFGEYM